MIKLNKSASDTRLCTMSPKKRFATLNFLGEFPGFFPIFCSAWFFLCLCILLPLCVFVLCPHLYVPGCSISRRRWSCQSSWGWQNPREKLRRTRFYTPNSTRDNNICSESRSRAAHMYIVHTVWSFTLGSSSIETMSIGPQPLCLASSLCSESYIPEVLGPLMNRFCRISA